MKKLTYDYVKNYIESFGEKLKSNSYKGAHYKLEIECKNGHIYYKSWCHFKKGQRCIECYLNKRKLNFDEVKNRVESLGYKLESKTYRNNNTKLKIRCKENHLFEARLDNLQNGKGCPTCSGNKKLTLKLVKNYIKKTGDKLLSEKYENARTKLKIKCKDSHIYYMRFDDFRKGQRCPKCWILRISGENNYNWRGGISCEPYCDVWLDREYKKSIKQRDNYTCQNEDCWRTSKKLVVHHINYIKKDCIPKNLITICNSCNARANYNRDKWERYYKNKIKEIYNE